MRNMERKREKSIKANLILFQEDTPLFITVIIPVLIVIMLTKSYLEKSMESPNNDYFIFIYTMFAFLLYF